MKRSSTIFKHELDSNKRSDDVNPITEKIKREITEIEHRTDLTDDKKVSQITHIACATFACIADKPIPFEDVFILTPIQGYFGTRIAAVRGVPVSENEVDDLIKEIVGKIRMYFILHRGALAIWRADTFDANCLAAGLLTIPLVYALSYANMNVIDAYCSAKAKRQRLSNDQIKNIWKSAFREGKKKSEEHQN